MSYKQKQYRRREAWTRETVINGLRAFYRLYRVTPTSSDEYHSYFSGQTGRGNLFPSRYGVLKHFETFRQAWAAADVPIDRIHEEWSAEEDRLLSEGAGIFTRRELGELVSRSEQAVHRRLYDLGINIRTARGWSPKRIARASTVTVHTLTYRYLRTGKLPYLRGTQCFYIDPADLFVVKEIDWDRASQELAEAARHSLMSRLIGLLKARLSGEVHARDLR